MEKYGRCVAIVPMSCALAQKGERLRLKKEILSKHTLKAVFSMPNELFKNSKVGVVTCIMVFEAHIPQPKNKKTFFGYFKDDGFYNKKTKGRFDYDSQWQSIKNKWLDLYTNNTVKVGFSKVYKVSADDEWCAEAYMETDYSNLKEENFRKTLLNYQVFLFANKLINKASSDRFLFKNYTLDVSDWGIFMLKDLFEITGSKTTPIMELESSGRGKFPYVTTQATNNGIGGFYNCYTENGGCLVVDSAVIGYCCYQKDNFSASDHVEKLIPKFEMNKYIALFLTTILNLEQYRYGYGRKFSQTRIKQTKIKLPANNKGKPDWQFMGNYVKSLPYSANL